MKRIYIAGPYSANNVMDVLKNIREGIRISTEVMKMGYSPFCPFMDFHFVLADIGNELKLEDFYRYSMDWLAVSDAILMTGHWTESKGCVDELNFAKQNKIPVFYSISDILKSDIETQLSNL
jgi:hypothetical protein